MTEPDWKAWAAAARRRGPRCPDAETLRRWTDQAGGAGSSADPARLEVGGHVQGCARCRIEAEELRSFFTDLPEAGSGARATEREFVRDALRRALAPPARRETVPPVPAAPPSSLGLARWSVWMRRPWLLALPAALLVGVGLAFLISDWPRPGSPRVPVLPPGAGALRGQGRPHLLTPRGDQATVPRRFSWGSAATPPGAWTFRLERVDGSLIWSTPTTTPSLELPEPVARELHPGSRYVWSVEPSNQPAARASAAFAIRP